MTPDDRTPDERLAVIEATLARVVHDLTVVVETLQGRPSWPVATYITISTSVMTALGALLLAR